MFYKISFGTIVFFVLIVSLFSQNIQNETIKNFLMWHLDSAQQIITYAPQAIEKYIEGKLYIDENYVYKTNTGSLLNLNNGKILVLPARAQDSNGHYLICSKVLAKKLFKNVCNNCGYEWEGGVLTFQCPRCKSTNFKTIPNW